MQIGFNSNSKKCIDKKARHFLNSIDIWPQSLLLVTTYCNFVVEFPVSFFKLPDKVPG